MVFLELYITLWSITKHFMNYKNRFSNSKLTNKYELTRMERGKGYATVVSTAEY